VSEYKGLEPALGRVAIAEGIVASPTEVADGVVCPRGAIDAGEVPRAQQTRQWPRITTGGFHAVAGFVRNEGGCNHPTVVTFLAQISGEPRATGPSCIDKEETVSLGLAFAAEVIAVGLSRPHGSQGGDLSTVVRSDLCDCDAVLMAIKADVACARMVRGGPPSACRAGVGMWWLWLLARSPMVTPEGSQPFGSHDV
jgi:hypothetical protein